MQSGHSRHGAPAWSVLDVRNRTGARERWQGARPEPAGHGKIVGAKEKSARSSEGKV